MQIRRRTLTTELLEDRRMLATLSIADVSLVNEDSGTFSATVQLSEPATLPVSVTVSTLDGTAVGGQDFVSESKSLTIAAGLTRETIDFSVLDDGDSEPLESLVLELSDPANATIQDGLAEVTLFDDDAGLFFSARQEIPSTMSFVYAVETADFNNDGHTDIVASATSDPMMWFESDGALGFTEHVVAPKCYACELAMGDMDGDGDVDIVAIPHWDTGGKVPLDELTLRWYENVDGVSFTEHILSPPDTYGLVDVVDLDADGDLDVLMATLAGGTRAPEILWLENDGTGEFVEHSISAERGRAISAVDIDGDGDLDILTPHWWSSRQEILWFENDGSQGFTEHRVPATAGTWLWMLRAADIDDDGDTDFYATFAGGSNAEILGSTEGVVWYENDGLQGFTEHIIREERNPSRYSDIHAVDMDGDGDLDMMHPSFQGKAVVWMVNDGALGFTSHTANAYSSVQRVLPIDFDSDGDIDMLSGGGIGWYENQAEDTQVPTVAVADVDTANLLAGWVTISLKYSDNVGVAPLDVDSYDIEVMAPNGDVIPAEFISRSTEFEQPTLSATYRITAPGGIWENDNYTIRMLDTQVRDISGRYVVAGDIQSFEIDVDLDCDYVGANNGCDIADLDALYAGSDGAPSPLNDAAIDAWLAEASAVVNPAKANASHLYVLGDTDLDGDVDSTDLGRLLNKFGDDNGLGWGSGNLNSDASVDSVDLGLLLNNFNHVSQSTATLAVSGFAVSEAPSVMVAIGSQMSDDDDEIDSDDDETLMSRVLGMVR